MRHGGEPDPFERRIQQGDSGLHSLVANLLLAVAWILLTGELSLVNLLFGLVLGYILLAVGTRSRSTVQYLHRVPLVLAFALYYAKEVVLANVRAALTVLFPERYLRPGVVAVPLDVVTDAEITLLANLINFTPGTLSLDVSTDRKTLYVHFNSMDSPEAAIREIKDGFERRVWELFN